MGRRKQPGRIAKSSALVMREYRARMKAEGNKFITLMLPEEYRIALNVVCNKLGKSYADFVCLTIDEIRAGRFLEDIDLSESNADHENKSAGDGKGANQ